MAFTLSSKPEKIRWPVTFLAPSKKKPGQREPVRIMVEFNFMSLKQFDDIMNDPDISEPDRIRKIMPSWGDSFKNEEGRQLDIENDDDFNFVMEFGLVREGIIESYLAMISGKAVRKN